MFALRYLGGGDPRLDGKLSLGVGGHVNPIDGQPGDALAAALRREWDEELDADFEPDFEPLGFIADDSTAISRVHVGFLYRVEAPGSVTIRETTVQEGLWLERSELKARRDTLDGWGRLVFDFLNAPDAAGMI